MEAARLPQNHCHDSSAEQSWDQAEHEFPNRRPEQREALLCYLTTHEGAAANSGGHSGCYPDLQPMRAQCWDGRKRGGQQSHTPDNDASGTRDRDFARRFHGRADVLQRSGGVRVQSDC